MGRVVSAGSVAEDAVELHGALSSRRLRFLGGVRAAACSCIPMDGVRAFLVFCFILFRSVLLRPFCSAHSALAALVATRRR